MSSLVDENDGSMEMSEDPVEVAVPRPDFKPLTAANASVSIFLNLKIF